MLGLFRAMHYDWVAVSITDQSRKHQLQYFIPHCNTKLHQNSFFVSTAKLWNGNGQMILPYCRDLLTEAGNHPTSTKLVGQRRQVSAELHLKVSRMERRRCTSWSACTRTGVQNMDEDLLSTGSCLEAMDYISLSLELIPSQRNSQL